MDEMKVVEQIYAAMAAADIGRLAELIDESVVITQDERLPWGGRFEGHPGFVDFAGKLTGTIASALNKSNASALLQTPDTRNPSLRSARAIANPM